MNNDRIVRPSAWYFAFAAAIVLAGFGLFLYALFHGIFHVADDLKQIVAPGEKDLTLMPNLSYTIFLETQSVVDGRIYSTSDRVSGLTCVVTSQQSGNRINTRSPSWNTTYSLGGRQGESVLEFVTQEAGVYHIACGYEGAGQGPQVVLAIGSGVGERIFSTVAKSMVSLFGGMFLGGAIILTVAVRRSRAKKRLAELIHAPL